MRPLAGSLEASIIAPLDAAHPDQEEALFARIAKEWGRLDIVVHSIAFARREDLQGRVVDSSAAGFAMAMDISVHSFVRLCRISRTTADRWRRLPDHEFLRRGEGRLHL